MNYLTPHRFDISVIIPLEYHRGLAVDCVRTWIQEQDYPAERYQIILCAPCSLDNKTEADIRLLMRPWDRLEKYHLNHDMSLLAEGAKIAESKLLFFTESHCLPEKNALRTLFDVAVNQADWAGFSCQTTPITHNLLSEIEAKIFSAHIEKKQTSAGWMKILDQCFLVHREAYFEVGGFQSSFGHFAEWLLAAEMHRTGKMIGSSSHKVIRHFYIGEITDLYEFTCDFALGQIKYLDSICEGYKSDYFSAIPELQEYVERSQADHLYMAKLKTLALPSLCKRYVRYKWQRVGLCLPIRAVLSDWLESLLKGIDVRLVKILASWRCYLAKHRLLQSLHSQKREQATSDFIDWQGKLVHLTRMQYLSNKSELQNRFIRSSNYPVIDTLNFSLVTQHSSSTEWLGFFDREESQESVYFRWSNPSACVWLPLHVGMYQIIIKWLKVRPLYFADLLSVNFDGQPIVHKVIDSNSMILNVQCKTKNRIKLDFTVTPFPANSDTRLLGLPITEICWKSV